MDLVYRRNDKKMVNIWALFMIAFVHCSYEKAVNSFLLMNVK